LWSGIRILRLLSYCVHRNLVGSACCAPEASGEAPDTLTVAVTGVVKWLEIFPDRG
jgi:hypothetical protein